MEPLDISRGGHEGASIEMPVTAWQPGWGHRPSQRTSRLCQLEQEDRVCVWEVQGGDQHIRDRGGEGCSEWPGGGREVLGGVEESKESKRRTHCGEDVTTMSSFREWEKASMA